VVVDVVVAVEPVLPVEVVLPAVAVVADVEDVEDVADVVVAGVAAPAFVVAAFADVVLEVVFEVADAELAAWVPPAPPCPAPEAEPDLLVPPTVPINAST
jgi:hypothetical protein